MSEFSMPNIKQLTLKDSMEFVRHVSFKHRDPAMLWGEPGSGKTQAGKQLIVDTGSYPCIEHLGQYQSVDLRGYPDHQNNEMVWYPPASLPFIGNDRFPDDQPVCLMFDEFNGAQKDVFGVAMQILLEHRVGANLLKPNVWIFCAGNREGDRGVTTRMPTPVANRLKHIEVINDVPGFCDWHQAKGSIPPVGIAFHYFRKQLISTFDPDKPDKAFATPRSWEDFWKYYQDESIPENIREAAMAGSVGQGPTDEVIGFTKVWVEMLKTFSMHKIMSDPMGTQLPRDSNMLYAISVAISGEMSPKTITPLHKYLTRLGAKDPEFVILAWQLAIRRDSSLHTTAEFHDFCKQFKQVFDI